MVVSRRQDSKQYYSSRSQKPPPNLTRPALLLHSEQIQCAALKTASKEVVLAYCAQ